MNNRGAGVGRPRTERESLRTESARRALCTILSVAVAALTVCLSAANGAEPPVALHVATFDSGFGGFLTAKSIESESDQLLRDYDAEITIHHYGDTANLPYGEKTPAQIAALGSAGVLKAFHEGADMVFITCNTASTQYARIREAVDAAYPGEKRPVVSIIDVSTEEAKRRLDAVLKIRPAASFVIMATPATVRSMNYPRRLAALYGGRLQEQPAQSHTQPRWYKALGDTVQSLTQASVIALPGGRRIDVYQLAPANWVEMIEHGADIAERRRAVRRDLGLLTATLGPSGGPDVIGYFCTHYPVLDRTIRAELTARRPSAVSTSYIAQGQLMANLFRGMARERLQGHERHTPASAAELSRLHEEARPDITISGRNGPVTEQLARTVFPHDRPPRVIEEDLGTLAEPAALQQ